MDYLAALRRQWWVILLAAVLGLAGATAAAFMRPPVYTTSLTMYVASQNGDSPQAAYQSSELAQSRVSSYTELVQRETTTAAVVRLLDLPLTPAQLADEITASNKASTVLIDVSVTDASPQRAAAIANAVGDVFPRQIAELERPTDLTKASPVAVEVVSQAQVPTAPSSPGLPLLLLIGLVAGLVVGLAAALIRDAIDSSVRSAMELSLLSRSPNLAVIVKDRHLRKTSILDLSRSHLTIVDSFWRLETAFQFLQARTACRVVLIAGPTRGSGALTIAANLAATLTATGKKVLLLEGDLRRTRLSGLFPLDSALGLTDVVKGGCTPRQTIQSTQLGYDVIVGGSALGNPIELLSSRRFRAVIDELRAGYDAVLVVAPPVLESTDATAIAIAADGAVLVCAYGRTTRDQVSRSAEILGGVSARVLGTVLTKASANSVVSTGRNARWSRSGPEAAQNFGSDQGVRDTGIGPGAMRSNRSQAAPALNGGAHLDARTTTKEATGPGTSVRSDAQTPTKVLPIVASAEGDEPADEPQDEPAESKAPTTSGGA